MRDDVRLVIIGTNIRGGHDMKILHTADWHLGKLVQGVYMTEDQRYILTQLIEAIDTHQPDVLVIAGDLYDRSVPPTEAIQLLDETFQTIIHEKHIPILAIAGNHDGASRIDFGTSLMAASGLHMVGKWTKETQPVILSDDNGEIHFWLVPFMDPSEVRFLFEDDDIRTHQQAMEKIVAHIHDQQDPNARHVFVGHAFVTKGGEPAEKDSDGERPLSIGGSECIDAALFDTFDYAAFGHLHGAHFVGHEHIRYSGSPLRYSISEEKQQKGYLIVDVTDSTVSVEKHLLTPKREMRRIQAYMADILQQEPCEDYVFVTLLDEQPILSPMEKIRSVYPNAMHVERQTIVYTTSDTTKASRRQMDDRALFAAFYEEMTTKQPSENALSLFEELLNEQLHDEREEDR